MALEADNARYDAMHEAQPYHNGVIRPDGTFESTSAKRTPQHPYHYKAGVTIREAETDENPHDHFLGGADECEECLSLVGGDGLPDIVAGLAALDEWSAEQGDPAEHQ